MKAIIVPKSYNYIGVFLTFACNMRCDYCINNYNGKPQYKSLHSDAWIRGLNRIATREDLPLTIQGGEPTVHPEFYSIINGIRADTNIDILTNGEFDIYTFMKQLPAKRLKRDAKYASIRFSYHPGYTDWYMLLRKASHMQDNGYSVGMWVVNHPSIAKALPALIGEAKGQGVDLRIKEFLGRINKRLYGTYKYKHAVSSKAHKVLCKPSELLIAPNGDIHRCHYYLYSNKETLGNILDDIYVPLDEHKVCNYCGLCNLCDIKLKYNRFQERGHCSVYIKEK